MFIYIFPKVLVLFWSLCFYSPTVALQFILRCGDFVQYSNISSWSSHAGFYTPDIEFSFTSRAIVKVVDASDSGSVLSQLCMGNYRVSHLVKMLKFGALSILCFSIIIYHFFLFGGT